MTNYEKAAQKLQDIVIALIEHDAGAALQLVGGIHVALLQKIVQDNDGDPQKTINVFDKTSGRLIVVKSKYETEND